MMHIAANARRRSSSNPPSSSTLSSFSPSSSRSTPYPPVRSSTSLGILDYDSSLHGIQEKENETDDTASFTELLSFELLQKYTDQCVTSLQQNCFSFSLSYYHFHFMYICTVGLIGTFILYGCEYGNTRNPTNSFIDCLFTAFSAICVTGLITMDTSLLMVGSQITIMVLIILGGVVLLSIVPVLIRRHYIYKHLYDTINDKKEVQRILDTEAIEYQALGYIFRFTLFYWLMVQIVIFLILFIAIETSSDIHRLITQDKNTNVWWWCVFHTVSSFNNAGFALLSDNLMSFYKDTQVLLPLSASILLGNIMFPMCIRLLVWIGHKLRPENKGLKYLLDHPRKCFTHMFNSLTTFVLISVLVTTTFAEYFIFLALDFHNEAFMDYSPRIRSLMMWFQSVSTRTAGFNCLDVSLISNGILVLEIWLMYLSAFPILLTIRHTERNMNTNCTDITNITDDKIKADGSAINSTVTDLSNNRSLKSLTPTVSTITTTPTAIVSSDLLIGLSLHHVVPTATKQLSTKRTYTRQKLRGDTFYTTKDNNLNYKYHDTTEDKTLDIRRSEKERNSSHFSSTFSSHNYRNSDILAMDGIVVPEHDVVSPQPEIEITEEEKGIDGTISTMSCKLPSKEENSDDQNPSAARITDRRRSSSNSSLSKASNNIVHPERTPIFPSPLAVPTSLPIPSSTYHHSTEPSIVSTTAFMRTRTDSLIELQVPSHALPSDIFVVENPPRSTDNGNGSNYNDNATMNDTNLTGTKKTSRKHVQVLYGMGRRIKDITSKDTSLLFFGLFLISAIDNHLMKHDTTGRINVFTIFFEIVSAYGTVGLSIGTQGSVLSLSAVLSPLSKLILIFIMILGRHRGLPSAIDPVVNLATLLNRSDVPKIEISPENLRTIGRKVIERTSSLIFRDTSQNNVPRYTGSSNGNTSTGTGLL